MSTSTLSATSHAHQVRHHLLITSVSWRFFATVDNCDKRAVAQNARQAVWDERTLRLPIVHDLMLKEVRTDSVQYALQNVLIILVEVVKPIFWHSVSCLHQFPDNSVCVVKDFAPHGQVCLSRTSKQASWQKCSLAGRLQTCLVALKRLVFSESALSMLCAFSSLAAQ